MTTAERPRWEHMQELLGSFQPPDPAFETAFEAWKVYFASCDAFDRMTCTGPVLRDGPTPATPFERQAINQHARSALRDVQEATREIDPDTVLRAKEKTLRASEVGRRRRAPTP